jgi:hypothetical protein
MSTFPDVAATHPMSIVSFTTIGNALVVPYVLIFENVVFPTTFKFAAVQISPVEQKQQAVRILFAAYTQVVAYTQVPA